MTLLILGLCGPLGVGGDILVFPGGGSVVGNVGDTLLATVVVGVGDTLLDTVVGVGGDTLPPVVGFNIGCLVHTDIPHEHT